MLIQLSLIHDQVKNLIASMIYIVVYQQEREKPIMAQGDNTSCGVNLDLIFREHIFEQEEWAQVFSPRHKISGPKYILIPKSCSN